MPRLSIFGYLILCASILVLPTCVRSVSQPTAVPGWPEVTSDNKIWTRWWWHGSAVTTAGISSELQSLKEAGFGGVELTPIFGVIGEEEDFVAYLSPQWMDLLDHTLREATRLGLQVDMATGTGWPFGGPWVGQDNAPKYIVHQSYEVPGGERLTEKVTYKQEPIFRRVSNVALNQYRSAQSIGGAGRDLAATSPPDGADLISIEDIDPIIGNNTDLQGLALDQVRFAGQLPLVSLMAYGDQGEVKDLTQQVSPSGFLDWVAPAGTWKLHALFAGMHGKMVERAAPGGEGNVIDHFSPVAIDQYLQHFNEAFAGHDVRRIRAFFNDSYEVDDARGQANWTPALLDSFEQQRGYDLREQLPALFGQTGEAAHARVLSDFRETFSELILETFTRRWDAWADSNNAIIRNQAHGSPANILDLYAASDIPETEGTQSLRIKFATSAANVTGKPMVSAEAATWLDEHFVATWSDLKANLDQYLVNGVNHLVYHGNAYSPPGDPFPGRLFYAAFHANSRHPMWDDLSAVNNYVSRVQSFLQRGSSDNDILLYFPIYDRFATPGSELLQHFDGHGPNLEETAVARLGEELLAAGYTFDFISDRQLQATTFNERVVTTGGKYRTVLVPATTYMPARTWEALMKLADAGATIVFQGQLPPSVPGFHRWQEREADRRRSIAQLEFKSVNGSTMARTGSGALIVADELDPVLSNIGILPERLVATGLKFSRRNYAGGKLYFISNWTNNDVDDWIPLSSQGTAAVLFDPMTGERGLASTETANEPSLNVRLQLPRGASVLVWVSSEPVSASPWPYFDAAGQPNPLAGTWKLEFLKGGPQLPTNIELPSPEVWNTQTDSTYQFFAGTGRYSTTFARPAETDRDYMLDLGRVYETARVSLNGALLATLTGPSYQIRIPADRIKEENTLTIDVSNRMINRVIKMDRDQVFWKKFYNVNMPARLRENTGPLGVFDASEWKPVPSGLAGPVTLTPGRLASEENKN